jgi:transposase
MGCFGAADSTGQARGRPRAVDVREVINTILYLNRTGCQWDIAAP